MINTARQSGYDPELIGAVDAVNNRQKTVLAGKISDYFSNQGGLVGKTLALWGLAFKANTDDIREASSLDLIRVLTAAGMRVKAFDPVAASRASAVLKGIGLIEFCEHQYDALEEADALAVVTDWNQFRNPDFGRIKRLLKAPIIFDGRNLYDPDIVSGQGLAYFSIGRAGVAPGRREPRAKKQALRWGIAAAKRNHVEI